MDINNLGFTSQLSMSQLYEFLEKSFPFANFSISFEYSKSVLVVTTTILKDDIKKGVTNPDESFYFFTDFKASEEIEKQWIKFLYKIFGEEYKKAFFEKIESKYFKF